MKAPVRRHDPGVGLPPGTLVHVGERKTDHVELTVMNYDAGKLEELRPKSIQECAHYRETHEVSWIDVAGIHDMAVIEEVGKTFDIHPLVLASIVNTSQRPKFEDLGDYCYFALKMLYYDPQEREIISDHVSILLGKHFVLSFQETPEGVFDIIRERIRTGKGRIRQAGCDYLAYSLMDAIIDNYFAILERFGDNMEVLEDHLVTRPSPALLREIYTLKRETLYFRKCAWPLREMVSAIDRAGSPLIQKGTRIYLRDLYDHAIQVIDTVENFREGVSGMLDIYLSSMSNRMNEVMKVLTIMASIFIPLTFLAGVYGMNFHYMPELSQRWGYPAALGLMAAVALGLLAYFKRKRWL